MKITVFVFALLSWIQLSHGRCAKVCLFHASSTSLLTFNSRHIDSNISSLCSHVIVGYGLVVDPYDPRIQTHEKVADFLPGLKALRKANGNFKILLQVQNWKYSSELQLTYENAISTYYGRRHFVPNIVKLLRDMGFDGIQIRESNSGRIVSIKKDHILFLQDLAAAFRSESSTTGRAKLLLFESLPESTNMHILDTFSDVNGICREVDMVILETQFFYLRNETHRHHSRLYGDTADQEHSVNFVTNYALSKGCAQEKLLIAISPESLTFEKSVGYFFKTKNFTLKGLLPYSYFCQSLKEYSPKVQRSNDLAPYVYYDVKNKYTKRVEKSVIHYFEDAVSLKYKVNYIKQKGLGGFVLWEFIHDDFSGNCYEGRYPILSILNRVCK
ncbi:chitotriosidase-1-like [Biomphalaria glabrata]|uniref:Chitotriosidase-1-like n=1 Tax=Biomphalaria glabrata TaxID=6526 RepID=A0A9W2ZT66_BIOGL|nr:chitotriosidase-1-like [Biomphalaria glabrata]